MIPYMNLNEQVDADFTRARRSARLRAVVARIRRDHVSNKLLSFDDKRREFAANNRLQRGTRVVEMDEIVGSVGRWRDFDRSFLPARASVGHRWKRIDRAFHRTEDLPPVKLYKLEEAYFVVDGHHRVSVARYHEALSNVVDWLLQSRGDLLLDSFDQLPVLELRSRSDQRH